MDIDLIIKYGPRMVDGLIVTLQLVGISLVIGALISLPVTAMRLSSNKALRVISYIYVYFFRGSPLLAQLFLVYYGSGQLRPFFQDIGLWWFFRDAWYCALFVFSLNTAAYQAEILRGGILGVDRGQHEAAKAFGLGPAVTFFKVILPQALISTLRPYGNEVILMIKGSAIASVVTIFDLLGATKLAFSRTFDFEIFLLAALMYLAVVEVIRFVWERMDRRLTRHLRQISDQ
ncbi:ABC transporter, permease protein (cluster 3, basic aa/glutamine/opines) [hydrothermal vent metagenome]|uniref:ABC transporter, permease protein (Cluster 3, basic aa/glutamine/opines) n=1 Tax=hydrothermal vent metagenome TaxID=652676 RepID=A0A3B0RS89_9ZZZZ